jgi:hypothetical protein
MNHNSQLYCFVLQVNQFMNQILAMLQANRFWPGRQSQKSINCSDIGSPIQKLIRLECVAQLVL